MHRQVSRNVVNEKVRFDADDAVAESTCMHTWYNELIQFNIPLETNNAEMSHIKPGSRRQRWFCF